MSATDCWKVNPEFHPGHDVTIGTDNKIACQDCRCVCTIADTWYPMKSPEIAYMNGRGRMALVMDDIKEVEL